jgi:predicted transcriptional regulator
MPWYKRILEFHKFDVDLSRACHTMETMQSRADDARVKPDLSSMAPAAIDAHEAGVLNAEREAREASKEHATKCREFRKWCARQREIIPLELEAREFNEAERAEGETFHKAIVERLLALEAKCPPSDDPPPGPKAIRTLG